MACSIFFFCLYLMHKACYDKDDLNTKKKEKSFCDAFYINKNQTN